MNKHNQKGFALQAVLLILFALIAVGLAGYFVVNKKDNVSEQNKVSDNSSDKSGWQKYVLKHEKLSFEYPQDWALEDNSTETNDKVMLKGKEGFTVTIETGKVDEPNLGYDFSIIYSRPIKFAGQSLYTVFVSAKNDKTKVGRVFTSTDAKDPFSARNAKNIQGVVRTSAGYPADGPGMAIADVAKDENFLNAQKISESARY